MIKETASSKRQEFLGRRPVMSMMRRGRCIRETDALGNVTGYAYDVLGRITGHCGPQGEKREL